MERWINLAGYQITWLAAVTGAEHGRSWPAWVASSLLCAGHVIASTRRELDLGLIGISAILGTLIDGGLTSAALLRYSPATPAVPLSGCPLWILALWCAFSTTLTRSLGWLPGRPVSALLVGAVGGPLSYLGAARGWGVLAFAAPEWKGIVWLAAGWAVALVILAYAARSSVGISGMGSVLPPRG